MSQKSFADLGVSRPVVGALAERGIHEPFAVQTLVIKDVLDGHDVLAQSPTGLWQDPGLRPPAGRPGSGRGPPARSPDPGSHARAAVPDRR